MTEQMNVLVWSLARQHFSVSLIYDFYFDFFEIAMMLSESGDLKNLYPYSNTLQRELIKMYRMSNFSNHLHCNANQPQIPL